jgi:2-polyprenyl-6-methoxyphenol hydroxylase-like FAD-dependent oxidoreductase
VGQEESRKGDRTAQVIVVGAGPAGAALSYLLARRGIDVVLLERQTDFEREFRGEGLMPTGIDAIRQMGLGNQLDALPHTVLKAIEVFLAGRRAFRIDSGPPDQDLGIRMISQPRMLEMLVAEASKFRSFRIERGSTVRDLVYENGRVAGVRVESHARSNEVHGDLTIGADGRASVLRKRSGLHEERFLQAFDVVWGKVPLPDFLADRTTARGYLGRDQGSLMFPAADGKLQIAWIIRKGSFGELRARGVEAWFEEMAAFVSPDMAAHLRASRDSVTHPFLLDVIIDRLVKWTAPGLLLLGDAAHPMSPVGAQGINIALRDALVAANHLVPVLTERADPQKIDLQKIDLAAKRVQEERLTEVAKIQELQDTLPSFIFGATLWNRTVRTLLFSLLKRPTLARWGFEAMRSRFASGVTEVRLRV